MTFNLSQKINRRTLLIFWITVATVYLLGIFLWGVYMPEDAFGVHYQNKLLMPSAEHWFGTDFMGRDMFYRSIKGLSNSMKIGILAAVFSSLVALVLGISSAVIGGFYDKCVRFAVDLCMGLPHLVLLLLISFMLGKGVKGITVAVALTHWPSLTRIVRAEVLALKSSEYVRLAYKLGAGHFEVAKRHALPHVLPEFSIGLILLFPHAIMHEAAITFLGFGLPPEMPAIGRILSEAMNFLTAGQWWLAVFPGLILLIAVLFFDVIGDNLKKLHNPNSANE